MIPEALKKRKLEEVRFQQICGRHPLGTQQAALSLEEMQDAVVERICKVVLQQRDRTPSCDHGGYVNPRESHPARPPKKSFIHSLP
jgi:hypothetical protein